jgi:hypothetical protein
MKANLLIPALLARFMPFPCLLRMRLLHKNFHRFQN